VDFVAWICIVSEQISAKPAQVGTSSTKIDGDFIRLCQLVMSIHETPTSPRPLEKIRNAAREIADEPSTNYRIAPVMAEYNTTING